MRRVAVLTTAAVALAALPIAAESAAKPNTGLSLKAQPNPVVFHRAVTLSGKLTGTGHADQTVVLQRDPFPYDSFVDAGTAKTNAGGQYTFTRHPSVNTRYRAQAGGKLSPVVTEKVRIRVSLRLSDSTPTAGHRVRFFGRACPQHDGATVKLQRFSATRHRWVTKRKTVLRDIPGSTCSKYSKRLRVFHDGTFRTVVVSNDHNHANGISRKRFINVHA